MTNISCIYGSEATWACIVNRFRCFKHIREDGLWGTQHHVLDVFGRGMTHIPPLLDDEASTIHHRIVTHLLHHSTVESSSRHVPCCVSLEYTQDRTIRIVSEVHCFLIRHHVRQFGPTTTHGHVFCSNAIDARFPSKVVHVRTVMLIVFRLPCSKISTFHELIKIPQHVPCIAVGTVTFCAGFHGSGIGWSPLFGTHVRVPW
mmetsp:Transcript_85203/g.150885  ORF Transcript_85203/g.150885 Transcript_85203/m.150885 type:complete len:202 (-) Transcript_85203:606-1211(-)